jgi:DNA replication protein DnaC
MSFDVLCHCGKRGALLANREHKLVRWHHCREHLNEERTKAEGLCNPVYPPSMPEIFRDTDINRLHPKIQAALDWSPSGEKSGLIFHGTTGVGKTRGVWEILRRMWVNEAEKDRQLYYRFLTMRKLEGMIEKSFDERNHSGMMEDLINCTVLIFDDFGKERLTQRMASDLFSIIDERSTAKRTTIISTNFNGASLLDRFEPKDKETGAALIRRLKDYYYAVGVG